MEKSILKSIIQSSLENSYRSDMNDLKMVDLDIDTIVLGVGIMAAVACGSYKDSTQGKQINDDECIYQAVVNNSLSIDESNSALYMLIPNDADTHYQSLLDSFKSHFAQQGDEALYRYSFDKLARALSNLQYKKAFVDVNTLSRRIDFYLNLGHKMLLTVSQVPKDVDDEMVMFSIEQNHETIVMDQIQLHELIGKIQQIQLSLS